MELKWIGKKGKKKQSPLDSYLETMKRVKETYDEDNFNKMALVNSKISSLKTLTESSVEKNFYVVENDADGNCLFYSIAQAILFYFYKKQREQLRSRDVNIEVKKLAAILRAEVCRYYKEFMVNDPEDGVNNRLTLIRVKNMTENIDKGKTTNIHQLSQLSKKICEDFDWGGAKETAALVELINANIFVVDFVSDKNEGHLPCYWNRVEDTDEIDNVLKYPSFILKYSKSGEAEHYELMVPKIDTPTELSLHPVPKSRSTKSPRSRSTKSPRSRSTKSPKSRSTQLPKSGSTQLPKSGSTQLPKSGSTGSPNFELSGFDSPDSSPRSINSKSTSKPKKSKGTGEFEYYDEKNEESTWFHILTCGLFRGGKTRKKILKRKGKSLKKRQMRKTRHKRKNQ
jgi:hypothetical protein